MPRDGLQSMQKVKNEATARETVASADPSRPFIEDIEPFLYGLPITYVDVGAYKGTVLEALRASEVRVQSAHLIEANPKTFAALQASLAADPRLSRTTCHNVAISEAAGRVTMRDRGDMTQIVPASDVDARTDGLASTLFDVNAMTLDDFARECGIDHIALLKIDVEGHELAVLKGARHLLASQAIDILYVEAGMDPQSSQQTYYRTIEDELRGHDYRLFRIYEQKNEWLDDSPALRRINMAFMSPRFTARTPYRLARDLFDLRKRNRELEADRAAFAERDAERERLAGMLAAAEEALREREARLKALDDRFKTEMASLKAKLGDSEGELGALLRAASGYEKTIAQMEGKIAALNERLAASSSEYSVLEASTRKLVRERDAFVQYADAMEKKCENLVNSRSWRITGPYRYLGKRLKRLLTGKKPKPELTAKRPRLQDSS